MVALEAAERVWEEVDARCCRGADVDRSGLEAGEGVQFLLARSERRERLARVRGEHAAGLGQLAAASVSLDEPLTGGRLEKSQVLAGARLSDPDRARGRGEASLPLKLNEQPQTRGVPEERESAIGRNDAYYRDFRLARWEPTS